MKKFFKNLRKRKFIRVISKILIVLIILILLLGWIVLFLMGNKGLKICYKDYKYGINIFNKVKICDEYKININQKTYDENNILQEELNYINGTDIGYEISYNNGNIGSLYYTIAGIPNNYKIINYYENGNIKDTRNIEKGNGKYFEYYENGQIKREGNYNNKKEIGTRTGYFENGSVQYIENYKNWKLNGEYFEYYENGQVKEKGFFIDGEKTGVREEYLDDGYPFNSIIY